MRILPIKFRWLALILLFLFFIILNGIFIGFTATNTLPKRRAGMVDGNISLEQLVPPECAGITIANIIDLSAGETPTSENDLILGTSGRDIVDGGAGDDCILGGADDDKDCMILMFGFCIGESPGLKGGEGNDVIIGGDGNDYIDGGDGENDICYGNAGNNQINNCETTP